MSDQSLPALLRQAYEDAHSNSVRDWGVLLRAASEIERLEGAVATYRWEEAARGLLVCYLQYQRAERENSTRRTVIHRADCTRAPIDGRESGMDLTWNVGKATGYSLRSALQRYKAQLCKVCKPNVEVTV